MLLTNCVSSEDCVQRAAAAHVSAAIKIADARTLAQRQWNNELLASGLAPRIAARTFLFRRGGALNRNAPFSIAHAKPRRFSTSVKHDAHRSIWLSTARL